MGYMSVQINDISQKSTFFEFLICIYQVFSGQKLRCLDGSDAGGTWLTQYLAEKNASPNIFPLPDAMLAREGDF